MKKQLRKLSTRALSQLAYACGLLLPYMTNKEKIEAINNHIEKQGPATVIAAIDNHIKGDTI